MPAPIWSELPGARGQTLAVCDWPIAAGETACGTVLLVHGLGEHIGRYQHVAEQLNAWGFAVCGYDQHGHGRSAGARGSLLADDQLPADLAAVIDETRARMGHGQPLILLGHSMGGLVAARLVALAWRQVDSLVLSSPALDAGMTPLQQALVRLLVRIAPTLRLGNGLDARHLSHDAAVVAAYQADALVHDRISARLARFFSTAGPDVIAAAPHWSVPTLLLYAGDDRLVNPGGSAAFAQAAPAAVVTAHRFASHWHELFNEIDRAEVFGVLHDWLLARHPPGAPDRPAG
ncbi:lysophospholipase [Ottowia sp.]|uniref:alpha/beta hydrolase n=1 Tax=Ottowia sp. TaxID=1898956 RepID=UPI002D0D242F|nr:lysophospholipase [Ottowia sp.]HRN76371.1 lysophospholipase [Ottowia sp.]HRQ02345.1 lysophospholipase [Ottowia sp.]